VGEEESALAAARRAVSLEPDNWRHYLRLGYVSWGEERLRAADRTLQLLPGIALAHWLAASVHVARQAFDAAERELDAGAAAQDAQRADVRFGAVGLHWLRGLVRLERGDDEGARQEFEQELSFESAGHLYARECAASAWYALGAMHARHGRVAEGIAAFDEAIGRVSVHAPALAARAALARSTQDPEVAAVFDARIATLHAAGAHVDAALALAIREALHGKHVEAAAGVRRALSEARSGSAGWIVPVEPSLHASARQDVWAPVLSAIRGRAA
jgi:tetratricopeptide (TPR) repeat protein